MSQTWVRQVFDLVPGLKRTLIIAIAFASTIECFKLVPPYLLKTVIDQLADETSLTAALLLIGSTLLVSILVTFVEGRYTVFVAKAAFGIEVDILLKAHARLLELGLAYHESHPSGDQVLLLNKGSNRLRELLWFCLDQFLGAVIQLVLTAVVLVFVHPACGLVFVSFLPLVVYRVHVAGQRLQPYREAYHAVFRRASWKMNQSLLNVRTVMDYVQEEPEKRVYRELLDHYDDLGQRRMQVENSAHQVRDWLLAIGRCAVLFYAVYLVFEGEMTTGTLFLFATLSEKCVASLYRLGRLYSYLGDSMEAVSQLTEIFRAKPTLALRSDVQDCPSLHGEISLRHVEFGYEPTQPVVRDVSLAIPARSVVAIVGRSGAGKTTLIKLLCRHYDVTGGEILVDGVDIRDYELSDYRRKVAVVSQDIQLFDTTVAENIAYGWSDGEVDKAEILRAARLANAHPFIQELPNGYDTLVGERGLKLSGGQRQRLGIARALLMRPAVLIFDEATSSLDTESERLIQDALVNIARQQTMILIAHRLSTIETADRIVVMDKGQVVEVGSPSELVDRDGEFARMRRLQSLSELRP